MLQVSEPPKVSATGEGLELHEEATVSAMRPHCTNVKGEHFELFKPGPINMVVIPQGRDPAEADFSIVVESVPTWWKKCAASFLSLAVIMRESGCEQISLSADRESLMPVVEVLPNTKRPCSEPSVLERIGTDTVWVKIGERKNWNRYSVGEN